MPGYTSAELLALREEPTDEPRPRIDHRQLMTAVGSSRVSFLFADYTATPSLVVPCLAHPSSPLQTLSPSDSLFQSQSILSRLVRYGRGVASLNLYPASRHDIAVNHLLWTVAQRGEYDPSQGNLILDNNVLALAMPPQLFKFLASISEADLKMCMLEVLALIAEDEDAEGLALMKSELEETMWQQLTEYMGGEGEARLDRGSPHSQKLLVDVERLLRLCYLSPWKIDVYACYITPQDMAAVLAEDASCFERMSPPPLVADRQLVRSSARRPVSMAVGIGVGPATISPRYRLTNKNVVFWKLFQDWRRYRKVLVRGLGVDPALVAHTMMLSIARGTQKEAWDRAEKVMACAARRGNLLATLPREVVYSLIGPHVLLAGSRT